MKNHYKLAIDNKKKRSCFMHMRQRLREGFFWISISYAVFLLISLISYHISDPGWSSTGLGKEVKNWGGRIGSWNADIFLLLFGKIAYLFPFFIVLSSLRVM